MIDIVHRAQALPQAQQIKNGVDKVSLVERAFIERRSVRVFVQFDVKLHPSHAGEIVFAWVKEHSLEQLRRRIQSWRISRTEFAIDLEQRLILALNSIFAQG